MISTNPVMVQLPDDTAIADPRDWFEDCRNLELEIGCGKGGFLLEQARSHPDRCFLGIEWANKYYQFSADRMVRWGITNVRVLRTDASHYVRRQLPAQCLSALHIYHPDPWPKKRHRKRRLIQAPFVQAAVRALIPGGRWVVQTDHDNYFQQIRGLLTDHPELSDISDIEGPNDDDDAMVSTNYAVKYRGRGLPIYRIAVERTG